MMLWKIVDSLEPQVGQHTLRGVACSRLVSYTGRGGDDWAKTWFYFSSKTQQAILKLRWKSKIEVVLTIVVQLVKHIHLYSVSNAVSSNQGNGGVGLSNVQRVALCALSWAFVCF